MDRLEKLLTFPGDTTPVKSLLFSQDGNLLASLGYDYVRLYSIEDKKELAHLENFKLFKNGACHAIGFDTDNKLLAFGTWAKDPGSATVFKVADVVKNKVIASIDISSIGPPIDFCKPSCVVFGPKCQLIAAIYGPGYRSCHGGEIFVWKLVRGFLGFKLEKLCNVQGSMDWYPIVTFNPDGNLLAATKASLVKSGSEGYSSIIEVWDIRRAQRVDVTEIRYEETGFKTPRTIHFTEDSLLLTNPIYTGDVHDFQVWDKKRNRCLTIRKYGDGPKVLSACINKSGMLLAFGDSAGIVELWDLSVGRQLAKIKAETQKYGIGEVAFSPDANLLASNGDNTELWRI